MDKNLRTTGTCGDFMTWNMLPNGKLIISGSGEMDDFNGYYMPPWCEHEVKEVEICEGVQTIGTYAFTGNQTNMMVEKVSLPSSLTKISDYAFWQSNIKSILIPSNVKTIGNSAFFDCKELSDVQGKIQEIDIEDSAFLNCPFLENTSTVNAESITSEII